MNDNIKPFYIYTDKNSLYIKNINEQTERLATNILTYCANINDTNNIHIFGLDTKGRLIHFFNNNGIWKKKTIRKIFNNIKNIKEMRLHIINDSFNLFSIENSPTSDNLYKIHHFNFNIKDYKIYKYIINNIYKDKEHLYKLDIDESSNIVFNYKASNSTTRDISNNTLIFNINSRKWSAPNSIIDKTKTSVNTQNQSTIKEDIFEYCYSIKYKL